MCAGALSLIGIGKVRTGKAERWWLLFKAPACPGAVCCGPHTRGCACRQVVYGAGNDRFGGCGSILRVHEDGCGPCGA